jgi:cell division protein FtsI (penicillin-binding protein 3)
VRNLMRAVVDNSQVWPKGVGLQNYQTGGKTGTAQRSVQSCRCYQGYVTSYVGFAPLNDPKILTYVVLNNPRRGQQSGTSSAAPVYKDIMNFALPRYNVPPTTKKLKPQPIAYGKKK